MKTTIEIQDGLFKRAQRLAREKKTTFRALTEQGLRLVLRQHDKACELPLLVTVNGKGLAKKFQKTAWTKIRDELYRGHGA